MWKSHGESKDDVNEMLNLYAWSHDFSNNPLLSTWVSYMNTIITDNPSKLSTLISTLETRFSDRPLLQILERAKKFLRMESAAAKLQTEKMQTIFASKISPKEAFHVLGLYTMGDSVLSNTVLKEWKGYVKIYNKANPQQRESWFEPLRIYYQHIERMIEAAKQNPTTAEMTKKAENAHHNYWLDQGKAPSDVFPFLFPKKLTEDILATPTFGIWTKYLENYNKQYPEQKTTMIDRLRANYNDLNILSMLNAEKNDRGMDKLVDDLKNAMVAKWVVTGEKLADLQLRFSHVKNGDEMIQRFKELKKVSENTS
ncbi:hypothetical protein JG688_00016006 [Phytophthora aleatoria]|uniref:RxLR effector protein n=1 Tax=Phytophthora aleatoria TaxID=2496075 RepID=A0A8J5IGS0_9STRA|nr:hypothetical protein JG688_00016006 [Phytophthora aleatoria]